jgi:hypothetical protein
MSRFLLALVMVVGMVCPSYGAEFLVRAKSHWMDEWTSQQVNALSDEEKESYDARTQREDIVVVRPDGWNWGIQECLPNFIIIKVPGMSMETASQYQQCLLDGETGKMKKVKKWHVKKKVVDDAIDAEDSIVVLDLEGFDDKKLEKLSMIFIPYK